MPKRKKDLETEAHAQSTDGRREAAVARAEAEFTRSVGRTRRFQWIMVVLLMAAVVAGVTLIPPTPEQEQLREIQENEAQTIRFVVPTLSIGVAPAPQTQTQPTGPSGEVAPPTELADRTITIEPAFLRPLLLDGLVRVRESDVMPSLCVAWTSEDEGRVWRLRAREGVSFHDGAPFETRHIAEAVRSLPGVMQAALVSAPRDEPTDPDAIARPPRVEAVVTLATANPRWIASAAVAALRIAKIGGVGGVIGTGPFRISAYTAGAALTLSAMATHHLAAPMAETLRFDVITSARTREDAVNAYDADIATEIPRSRDAAVLARPRLRVWATGADDKIGWLIGPRIDGEPDRGSGTAEFDLTRLLIRPPSEWWVEDR